jgi:flagellar basal body-associated protein FliL
MYAALSMIRVENAVNVDSMRILLFVLLMVAILLILAGAGIALWTLSRYRKARSSNIDDLATRG